MFFVPSSTPVYADVEEGYVLLSDKEMDAATAAGYTFAISGSAKNLGVPRDVNPACAKCGASPATVVLPKGVGSVWTGGGNVATFRNK